MFSFILAGIFLFVALICYASCYVASEADRMSEEYWQKKIYESEMKNKSENLKNK